MKTRHIQTTRTKTKNGFIYQENSVYLPRDKKGKLQVMGEDFWLGRDYKKTYNNGSVAFSLNDGKVSGHIYEAVKGQRARGRFFVPYSRKK